MSRMTSAQVISLGEYLDPDFDPSSLTVSQLLGVLSFHNINYPSPYSKPKLVQLFKTEITTKATKLKKERLQAENSIPSDDGITDGLTGKPLGSAPLMRRSSRRLSRVPKQETSPTRPDSPKRRRSSAQPTLGPSYSTAGISLSLVEESEPEDNDSPIRKVRRNKKNSETAGVTARRVSHTAPEDSGWEDNNIFQSGAESSSPARPSPARPKGGRKSAVPRQSRKSSSAPPQVLLSTSPQRPTHSPKEYAYSPPQSNFSPRLPTIPSRNKVIEYYTPLKSGHEDINDEFNLIDGSSNSYELSDAIQEGTFDEDLIGKEQSVEDHHRSIDTLDGQISITPSWTPEDSQVSGLHLSRKSGCPPLILRFAYAFIMLVVCGIIINFKMKSARIGYCDAGTNTNTALEELRDRRSAIEVCNRENRTLLYSLPQSLNFSETSDTGGDSDNTELELCPLPSLLPLPQPDTCTPCPDHATCSRHSITCDTGYLLRSHPLLFFLPPSSSVNAPPSPIQLIWRLLSGCFDGLPGLGSVALPPRCIEDPKRKRNIGSLGKAIESLLGQERGRRVCAGGEVSVEVVNGGEANRWGMELEDLRDTMKKKTPAHLLETFDDTFTEAIQQLIQWGGVIIGEDRQSRRYVAHKVPDLTWDCVITVRAREWWVEWRTTVLGLIFFITCILFGRVQNTRRQAESKRIVGLVQIALDALRSQELAYHTDPVTTPYPYLSSVQLRDLILQGEHSISYRSRLWDQVERIVEGNSNVRVNLEEIQGGDEMRVWRWVGSGGKGRVQEQPRPDRDTDSLILKS